MQTCPSPLHRPRHGWIRSSRQSLGVGMCFWANTCQCHPEKKALFLLCLFSTSSRVYFRPHDEVSHLRDGAHFLRDLLLRMEETEGGLCFWLRTLHLSLIDFLEAREKEDHSIHTFNPHTWHPSPDSGPLRYPDPSRRGRPEICSLMSPEAMAHRSARGDRPQVLWARLSEPPGASLTFLWWV